MDNLKPQPFPQLKHLLLTIPRPHILLITINRPQKMNSLPYEAHWEMDRVLTQYQHDDYFRVAVLTGAGDKAFCAGMDLSLVGGQQDPKNLPKELATSPPSGFAGICKRTNLTKPLIAAVNGFAYGGGTEIAIACDMVIAADSAKFGLPEVRRGIFPPFSGTTLMARVVGMQRAMQLVLTGEPITAKTAYEWGFVNEVVTPRELLQKTFDWADLVIKGSPDATRAAKKAILLTMTHGNWVDATEKVLASPEARAMSMGVDSKEGPRAFVQKRPPKWNGYSKL